jgi:hypothetical protein
MATPFSHKYSRYGIPCGETSLTVQRGAIISSGHLGCCGGRYREHTSVHPKDVRYTKMMVNERRPIFLLGYLGIAYTFGYGIVGIIYPGGC